MSQSESRDIHPCNFRYAGRLSNENTRALTTLCEKFAVSAANALEACLGAALDLKLVSIDQHSIQDYLAIVPPDCYLIPCALSVMDTSFLLQLELPLALPIIDLLLGGAGTALSESRELSEIDEKIMQGVSALIIREIENSWRTLHLTYTLGHCIKAATLPPLFTANERVVILLFAMDLAGVTGDLRIVLPASFVGYLLRHIKAAQSKKMPIPPSLGPSLRHRILDSRFTVSTDITQMRVRVNDLLSLQPGTVLGLIAPVKAPGRLTIEELEIYEAAPVRSGPNKAAHLLSRLPRLTANAD